VAKHVLELRDVCSESRTSTQLRIVSTDRGLPDSYGRRQSPPGIPHSKISTTVPSLQRITIGARSVTRPSARRGGQMLGRPVQGERPPCPGAVYNRRQRLIPCPSPSASFFHHYNTFGRSTHSPDDRRQKKTRPAKFRTPAPFQSRNRTVFTFPQYCTSYTAAIHSDPALQFGKMEYARLETALLKDVTDDYYYGCSCQSCLHTARLSLSKLRSHLGADFPLRKIRERLKCQICFQPLQLTFACPWFLSGSWLAGDFLTRRMEAPQ